MSLRSDGRVALRSLAGRPGFTLVVIATLALGLGAATAWLDLVNLLVWRKPMSLRPNGLVQVYTWSHHGFVGPYGYTPYNDYLEYRDRVTTLSGLAAFQSDSFELSTGEAKERVTAWMVSGNYFEVLELPISLGRALEPQDDRVGAAPVVMLSHRLWSRLFGGDEAVLGREVQIAGRSWSIVGIGPPGYTGDLDAQTGDVFLPISGLLDRFDPSLRSSTLLGRTRPGLALEAAQSELAVLADELERRRPMPGLTRRLTVIPAAFTHPIDRRGFAPTLRLLGVGAGLLLVLACANVANLLLTRTVSRERETGIRKALGASSAQILRLPLIEALLLSFFGALAGLLLAFWARGFLRFFIGPEIMGALRLEARVLVVLALVTVTVALAVTIVPHLVGWRVPALSSLKGAGASSRRAVAPIHVLAVVQVAICVALLASTGLLGWTLRNLLQAELGFDTENLVHASVSLPEDYSAVDGQRLLRELRDRAVSSPSIASGGMANLLPPFVLDASIRFRLAGDPDAIRDSRFNVVDGAYFRALGIPLLQGRLFEDRDAEGTVGVAIVNRALAEELWPHDEALGQRLRTENHREGDAGPDLEVVGVVGDSVQHDLRLSSEPILYLAKEQRYRGSAQFVFRTTVAPEVAFEVLRETLRALDPTLTLSDTGTWTAYRWTYLLEQRLQTLAVGTFGAIALLLAVLGIFGVMGYAVSRETRQIGIRMAVGARQRDILRWVVGRGVTLALVGAGFGVLGALAATPLLQGLVHGVGAALPWILVAVVALIVGVAAGAAYTPARRAAGTDPALVLRSE